MDFTPDDVNFNWPEDDQPDVEPVQPATFDATDAVYDITFAPVPADKKLDTGEALDTIQPSSTPPPRTSTTPPQARPPTDQGGGLPAIDLSDITYRSDTRPDPTFPARKWAPVAEPTRLFDLKLRDDMWPRSGFLAEYLRWIEPTTDTPRVFHLMTALSVLGTALGRSWSIEDRSGGVFPNLYVLLIAASGTRKSSAVTCARRFTAPTNLMVDKFESTCSFMAHLQNSGTNNWLWVFDEAVQLFVMFEQRSALDLPGRLTTAYDGHESMSYTSKAAGTILVPEVSLGILGATPLEVIRARRLSDEFLRGGLLGRTLWVPASTEKAEMLDPPQPDPRGEQRLAAWLDSLTALGGPFQVRLGREAREEFLAWLVQSSAVQALQLAGVWSRRSGLVKRIALLYHVAALRSSAVPVQHDSMLQAIALVNDYLLPGLLWVATRLPHVNPFRSACLQVEERLECLPAGVPLRAVSKDLGIPPRQSNEVLYSLYLAGKLDFISWKDNNNGGHPQCLIVRRGVAPIGREGYSPGPYVPKFIRTFMSAEGPDPDDEDDLFPVPADPLNT